MYEKMFSEEEFVALFCDYLLTSYSSGFGQHFSIHDEEGRERCARWFVKHLMGMLELEQARLS